MNAGCALEINGRCSLLSKTVDSFFSESFEFPPPWPHGPLWPDFLQLYIRVVYFDQLLVAVFTWKLVKILSLAIFNLFCWFFMLISDFSSENNYKFSTPSRNTPEFWCQPLLSSIKNTFFQRFFYCFCMKHHWKTSKIKN